MKNLSKTLMLVAFALVAFASPALAQPEEEHDDQSCTPVWGTYVCSGGGASTCATASCPECYYCSDTSNGPWCFYDHACDEWEAEIINFREPDPLGGDPAFLRTLGVDVPAPACLSEQVG